MRYEFIRKPRKCPAYASIRIADIMYGYPIFSEELDEVIKSGKLFLGDVAFPVMIPSGSASIVMCLFIKKKTKSMFN